MMHLREIEYSKLCGPVTAMLTIATGILDRDAVRLNTKLSLNSNLQQCNR